MNKVTHWLVPPDHPAFAGHFPGTPILPGVVLLDVTLHAIAGTAGIEPDGCEIGAVKFLSPAKPGDALEIRYDFQVNGAIRFEIVAGPRKIASGNLLLRSAA